MLPGSVTAKVLHDIEIPVFTSAHAPETLLATQHGFRRILCPLRMDADSETTLTMAGFLAHVFDARVCLLHVKLAGESQSQDASIPKILQFVERTLGPDGAADLDVHCRILNDSISDGIRKTAIEEGADLVVVGRGHAKAQVSRVWTHLYTVIRESPCPVLSV
jgi:Universal stress protein family